eukprot:CAMPEP_0118947924 /NCGR_PEP_ID=MMETSP1169-20130426/46896_1 /TAXON_ID=36882 /ORGANISM="Pyramimonas obovata, Strain CCMP722" /LENGTH=36 /DNA_ID= /DNA_START= /DNA_END= /DNA_ORIENTATION=
MAFSDTVGMLWTRAVDVCADSGEFRRAMPLVRTSFE